MPVSVDSGLSTADDNATTSDSENDSEVERTLAERDESPGQRCCGPDVKHCWRYVFGAHFLRTWAERAWEFAVGLILLALNPDTLWLVALYGLLENTAVVLLGPMIGAWLDWRVSHVRGAVWTYQCQNICNILSAAFACLGLVWTESSDRLSMARKCFIGGMMLTSCVARLASAGATMSVEKKWLKALCTDEPEEMARISAIFRRVDLVCLFAAPIFTGSLMTLYGLRVASIALAVWNAITWIPQVLLLRRAASLASLWGQDNRPWLSSPNAAADCQLDHEIIARDEAGRSLKQGLAWLTSGVSSSIAQLHVFWKQTMALAMISLAMLYFSVLSFGLIMTSYLKWSGISEAELSLFRGLGAVVSVLATVSFPPLNSCAGAKVTGLMGISIQLLCLSAAAMILIAVHQSGERSELSSRMYIMLMCLILSRWGLWTFDLAVTQQMQEGVSERELGVTSGVQGSLQSLFELSISVVTVLVSKPVIFPRLALVSLIQVCLAFFLYVGYLIVPRRCSSQRSYSGLDQRPFLPPSLNEDAQPLD